MGRTKPATDPLDALTATIQNRGCGVCRCPKDVTDLIARFVERTKTDLHGATVTSLYDLVLRPMGVAFSESTLRRHLWRCTGGKGGPQTR